MKVNKTDDARICSRIYHLNFENNEVDKLVESSETGTKRNETGRKIIIIYCICDFFTTKSSRLPQVRL